MFRKSIGLIITIAFLFSLISPVPRIQAQPLLGLPEPGDMVNLSPAYKPAMIKGMTIHKDNPFLFDFIVDVGQDHLQGEALKKEGEKLIKYFLASLAIPEQDLWVNLSPYEKDRTIPKALGRTEMGRDLLAQDYILKQLTASLIYPERKLGKSFWDKVYAKAQEMYGTTQVPINTFNKVWIMADKAEVFERNNTIFVVGSHLKVMLEEDYLALNKHSTAITRPNQAHSVSSQIVREIILPEIEKEVNTGRNFANLRQIVNSLILANWYKDNLKQALLNQVYSDKNKVKGINLRDKTANIQIYERYLKAYKKGVFNFIKEDMSQGEMIPRKYFSGGIKVSRHPKRINLDSAQLADELSGDELKSFKVGLDAAMVGHGHFNPKFSLEANALFFMAVSALGGDNTMNGTTHRMNVFDVGDEEIGDMLEEHPELIETLKNTAIDLARKYLRHLNFDEGEIEKNVFFEDRDGVLLNIPHANPDANDNVDAKEVMKTDDAKFIKWVEARDEFKNELPADYKKEVTELNGEKTADSAQLNISREANALFLMAKSAIAGNKFINDNERTGGSDHLYLLSMHDVEIAETVDNDPRLKKIAVRLAREYLKNLNGKEIRATISSNGIEDMLLNIAHTKNGKVMLKNIADFIAWVEARDEFKTLPEKYKEEITELLNELETRVSAQLATDAFKRENFLTKEQKITFLKRFLSPSDSYIYGKIEGKYYKIQIIDSIDARFFDVVVQPFSEELKITKIQNSVNYPWVWQSPLVNKARLDKKLEEKLSELLNPTPQMAAPMAIKTPLPEITLKNARSPQSSINGNGNYDKAAIASPNGGIDLNTRNMHWKISKDGKGVEMNVDPAMVERFKREGIDSLTPVIFRITPIQSIWPILGLEPPKQ